MSILKYRNSASDPWQEIQTINGEDAINFISMGTVTLTAANWAGNGPYTQTVTIPSVIITANSKVDIQPNSTAIQHMLDTGTFSLHIENNNGTLTAYAFGPHPTIDLTLQVTITEVEL